MRSVGDKLPAFRLQAVVSTEPGREFQEIDDKAYPGKWKVVFFWPMDFTFVCPTEIAEFGRRTADFRARGAEVLGVSTDTHYVHLAWRTHEPMLRDLPFPMIADTKRELATALGVLHPSEGVALRATFIVDPEGTIRHASVNDLAVGRSVDETLRILAALQTGGLTPCNWKPGDPNLRAA
ncbi:MAG TPA: peroxiredoxin [Candidatus Eisenbacteria bacterium]|nr:peroxiredoxin [Candidatus Eisenbacteria bacterium]